MIILLKVSVWILALTFLSYSDFKTREISNKVVFALLLIGIGVSCYEVLYGNATIATRAVTVGATIFIMSVLYMSNAMPAGDCKLFMVFSLFYGLYIVLQVFLWSLVIGIGYVIVHGFFTRKPLSEVVKYRMPFVVPIYIAYLIVMMG